MILVFQLMIYINGVPQINDVSYWKSALRCAEFSQIIRRQNYSYDNKKYPQPEIGAVCVPKMIKKNSVLVWE